MKNLFLILLLIPSFIYSQSEITFVDQFRAFVGNCDLSVVNVKSTETKEGFDLGDILDRGDFTVAPEFRDNYMLIDKGGSVIWEGRHSCNESLTIYYVGGRSAIMGFVEDTKTREQEDTIQEIIDILENRRAISVFIE